MIVKKGENLNKKERIIARPIFEREGEKGGTNKRWDV